MKKGIDKKCSACGALFYVEQNRADSAKFCSMKCMWAGRPKKIRRKVDCVCEQCGETYGVAPYRKDTTRFCSSRCAGFATVEIRRRAILVQVPTGMKKCSKCKVEKPRSDFRARSNATDGIRGKCLACDQSAMAEWTARNHAKKLEMDRRYYAKNGEKQRNVSRERYAKDKNPFRERNKKWREKNIDRAREKNRQRRERNPELVRERRRQHYQENKARYKAQAVARTKHIKIATPAWADMEKIYAFYAEAERMTKATGILHHVDHIYPLRGKTMCGLHVEGNLQILPAVANLLKSNRVAPDAAEVHAP